ncbi:hypothetical protein FDZ73_24490, partial [bacterium]
MRCDSPPACMTIESNIDYNYTFSGKIRLFPLSSQSIPSPGGHMTDFDLTPLKVAMEEYAPKGRTALLPALHTAQEIYGYLPEVVATEVARSLKVPLVEVFGVIDFYAMFYREPVGKTIIHVCTDPACAMAGSEPFVKRLTQHLEFLAPGEESSPSVTIERAPCLGLCEHAPALLVNGKPVGKADLLTGEEIVANANSRLETVLGGSISLLTANCG